MNHSNIQCNYYNQLTFYSCDLNQLYFHALTNYICLITGYLAMRPCMLLEFRLMLAAPSSSLLHLGKFTLKQRPPNVNKGSIILQLPSILKAFPLLFVKLKEYIYRKYKSDITFFYAVYLQYVFYMHHQPVRMQTIHLQLQPQSISLYVAFTCIFKTLFKGFPF